MQETILETGIHILVVEDEKESREFLVSELERKGYQVSFASHGPEALDLMSRRHPDLVLTDMVMPRMSGLELLEKIKKIDPDIPVIFVTGFGTLDAAVEAMQKGAFDYVSKPLHLSEVSIRVEKAIEKARQDKLERIHLAGRNFFSLVQLPELFQAAVDFTAKIFQAEECALVLQNPANQMECVAPAAITDEEKLVYVRLVNTGFAAIAKSRGGVIGPQNFNTISELRQAVAGKEYKSAVFCPLIFGQQTIGALIIFRNRNASPFNKIDLKQLGVLTSHLSVAVQNAKKHQHLLWRINDLKNLCVTIEESRDQRVQAEKLSMMSRLVSGIAHEINNPLTAVMGYAQLLLDNRGQNFEKQITVIRDQAQRCGKIIQDLMAFARRRKIQEAELDLHELIDQVLQELKGDLDSHHVQVVRQYASPKAPIFGDALQLRKVFYHLVLNAMQASEGVNSERKIRITTCLDPQWALIDIEDNGVGIPQENLNKIFDPFFTTRGVGRGSGLGLSLVQAFIVGHGGMIHVQKKKDNGTCFKVRLPRQARQTTYDPIPIEAAAAPKRRRILVVEDESLIADFIARIFQDRGYEVKTAFDGEMALELLRKENFDLVVSDYKLPKLDGFQVFERITREKKEMEKKFIFVTASVNFREARDDEFFKKLGVGYLPKPFVTDDLLKIVEQHLKA